MSLGIHLMTRRQRLGECVELLIARFQKQRRQAKFFASDRQRDADGPGAYYAQIVSADLQLWRVIIQHYSPQLYLISRRNHRRYDEPTAAPAAIWLRSRRNTGLRGFWIVARFETVGGWAKTCPYALDMNENPRSCFVTADSIGRLPNCWNQP